MPLKTVIASLLASEEPCVQYKVRAGVLGESPSAKGMASLRQAVRDSPRVRSCSQTFTFLFITHG